MYINNYFSTPVWTEEKPEFVKSLNKAGDKYIKAAKKMPEGKKYLNGIGIILIINVKIFLKILQNLLVYIMLCLIETIQNIGNTVLINLGMKH